MKYDAVIVPGGGVRPGGELPRWVKRRFDLAIELRGTAPIIALSAGTTHRPPPLDATGFPIFESVAGAKYLLDAGVPARSILIEAHSWDTIGNAFFSRVIHAEPRGFQRLLIVNSEFHLPRTEAIFKWVFGLTPRTCEYELYFKASVDEGMDPLVRAGRIRKESEGIEALQPLIARLSTMQAFHEWLFTEHNAYRAGGAAFSTAEIAEDALRSY